MENGESSWRRFMRGDPGGFEETVEMYRLNLIYFVNRFVRNAEIAEDIAADTFADLFIYKNRYNYKTSLKTYIFTIGRNKAVNYIRRNTKYLPFDEDIAAGCAELEQIVLREERDRQLNAALNKLKADYRAILHLLYFEQLSYEDAAKILGKNKKQIDNLAYRAKLALKSILLKEGFEYEIQ